MYRQWHLPYRHHKATKPAWGLLGWHSAGWALALFLKSDDALRETTVRKDLKSYQQGVTQPKWSHTPHPGIDKAITLSVIPRLSAGYRGSTRQLPKTVASKPQ